MSNYIDDDDFMEMRYQPEADGWHLDTLTGNHIDPAGNVYDALGELIQSASYDYDKNEFPHI